MDMLGIVIVLLSCQNSQIFEDILKWLHKDYFV